MLPPIAMSRPVRPISDWSGHSRSEFAREFSANAAIGA
jgi:hypothetical protein